MKSPTVARIKRHARGTQWCPGSYTRVIDNLVEANGKMAECPHCGRVVFTVNTVK